MAFDRAAHLVLIVMGVSGSGKTTIGRALASAIGWAFIDADDFHSPAAIEKMRQSIALTEADRRPWIEALVARLNEQPAGQLVLACSALTHAIRERFRSEVHSQVVLVYLKLDEQRLHTRLSERHGHYAEAGLLKSQLATLEEPHDAITVVADGTPDALVAHICDQLASRFPA